ncbi:PREDICTED: nucleolar protein 4-like isoform X2 [Nicrophorus vespilloides]|uniref:Nucleolar protein 4-like isoform X2 n=1 Tax=Nicrophorus vespilloides TaxID=110193 RepID=A0ABM1MD82_NICVS|nr:PREDICTED: nucleolar protein 4-like isoform X2 [Nicrophorus vespilloides]
MATAMLADRGLRSKMGPTEETVKPPVKKAVKRKSTGSVSGSSKCPEQNNNVKRAHLSVVDSKVDMFASYQPWVIQTYGDLAKTKTVTLKKYARILRTLRFEEVASADNSKFRFWVKAKGFHMYKPAGYEARPADAIVGRYSVCDVDEGIPPVKTKLSGSAKDPFLYVPNAPFKNSSGEPVYRKVAIVENFFDIIYNVHVELEGRPGKHAGQKRTYRTITETYAFLPREAVTRFLLGCTECQKHPRSPSPISVLPTPSPSPTLPPLMLGTVAATTTTPTAATPLLPVQHVHPTSPSEYHPQIQPTYLDLGNSTKSKTPPPTKSNTPPPPTSHPHHHLSPLTLDLSQPHLHHLKNEDTIQNYSKIETHPRSPQRSTNPLDVCNLTSRDSPRTPPKKRHLYQTCTTSTPTTPKLWSPVESIEREQSELIRRRREGFMATEIDYSLPITTTYLKYMRSLGCTDEDALKFESKNDNLSMPESSEPNEEDQFSAGNRNGTADAPELSNLASSEEMAGLWAQYHSALGLAKGKATPPVPRDQSSPVNAETGSAHDETSSSGNKEDEDDDDDESDDKIDIHSHDPERLKAFNMFVRLFVDENLDRMVPISKQPKEKIQAIIDSCTRQFPEFAERARKRIRTYLKSCRRNKRARDPNSPWDATRPTPAHLTSVQAEQILATACENESHNAKRMRLGLEPVSQPMPLLPGTAPTDTTATISRGMDFTGSTPVKLESDVVSSVFPSSTTPSTTPNSISKSLSLTPDMKPSTLSVSSAMGTTPMNGIGISSSTAGSAPTAMYRPNFSQAFQRAGPYPLFPGQSPFATATVSGSSGSGLLTNGPADLSMKQKPLLNHKLSTGEMAAVRQLITGYRESAAFLLRSADELEQLLLQQQ